VREVRKLAEDELARLQRIFAGQRPDPGRRKHDPLDERHDGI
jgi:hypothetical protein